MREFFELINEYPWTTVLLVIGLCLMFESIGTMIHGPGYKITYKSDKPDKSDKEKNSGS